MKMSPRSQKLAGVVREHLPPLIQRFTNPEEVGFITVSAIEISGDLGVCDIFIRRIGGEANATKILNKAGKKIASELAKLVQTRRVMVLRFKNDASVKHVESLGDKLS